MLTIVYALNIYCLVAHHQNHWCLNLNSFILETIWGVIYFEIEMNLIQMQNPTFHHHFALFYILTNHLNLFSDSDSLSILSITLHSISNSGNHILPLTSCSSLLLFKTSPLLSSSFHLHYQLVTSASISLHLTSIA
jgi:hypothetical protein